MDIYCLTGWPVHVHFCTIGMMYILLHGVLNINICAKTVRVFVFIFIEVEKVVRIDRGYLCFQCKVEFYFTEWTPQAVFSRVAIATSENTDCGVHRNKIQSYSENISVSFMLLFLIIMFLPTRQLSRQKVNCFPSHFALISSCSACLVGLIWG